ncbi:MAG: MarR family transcriptional regulator [Clostridiales bacterium]|nr:MarR family transcriptional regulator [Clostridiales bacterium]
MKERFELFTVLIAKISRSIRKIKTEEMEEFDLKSPHVSCLYYLFKSNNLTATELCEICQEDKSAISRSLDYLESKGYISCDSNLKKRYKCHLTLTEKGQKIGKIIADKIDEILEIASDGLTEEKRIILYESLTLISDNLEKYTKNIKHD